MTKTFAAAIIGAAYLVAATPAFAAFKLEITEIWPGNFAAPDATPDWFEITNTGNTAWVAGTNGNLYFDDDSLDPTAAVLLQGISTIAPGQTVVFVEGGATGVTQFTTFWSGLLPGGLQIGRYTNNSSGLSNTGDTVALWIGPTQPLVGTAPSLRASFPSTVGFRGASYDTRLRAFSTVGNAASAVSRNSTFPANADPTTGSPGQVLTSSSGSPGVDLRITEIWPGNVVSPDSTEDWFEVTNLGGTTWQASIHGNLYYDNNSASAAAAVPLTGVTQILPGQSAIFTETADTGVQEFRDFWEVRLGRSLVVGTYQGSAVSLSASTGDTVNLWMLPSPPTSSDPIFAAASFLPGSNGASMDSQLSAFSTPGNAAGAIQVMRGGLPPEPTTASPGNLPPPASPPDWDRKLLAEQVVFGRDPTNRVFAVVPVGIVQFTTAASGANLDTRVSVSVGGTQTDTAIAAYVNPGGIPGNCDCLTGIPCNTSPGYCDRSEFGCWCGVIVRPRSLNLGLIPNNTPVTIRISPATAAVAEQYVSDDEATVVFSSLQVPSVNNWGLAVLASLLLGAAGWSARKRLASTAT